MANEIALFEKYINLLDEVYQNASKTADLDGDATLVRAGANANEISIPKMTIDGLANYSRNDGYKQGSVSVNYETVQFNYDRGRKFNVDAMDNEETAGIAFGKLSSEFLRTKVVPEVDAFRFAKYATEAGTKIEGTLSTGEDWLGALVTAQSAMDDDEVTEEGRILYITPEGYNAIMAVDTTKSKEVLASFSKIVKVPSARFNTEITLKTGADGQEEGGFVKSGKDLNFLIIEKSAVLQYPKHKVNKIITPEANQENDGWLFFYREYGLADVYENKVAGIYAHSKTGTVSL